MNVKEQEHCKRVAALGCYICGAEPQLHHIRNDGTVDIESFSTTEKFFKYINMKFEEDFYNIK